MGLGKVKIRNVLPETFIDKIFENNYSSLVK